MDDDHFSYARYAIKRALPTRIRETTVRLNEKDRKKERERERKVEGIGIRTKLSG